ncbi:hypothetical protein D9V37_02205 [Nocardioides mangrovicus]|uniref:Uncharacterized protein n=1 Tax=Nocardioides mangrovicus TaxID=2478913 RepID=A0A3L8P6D6_9ACTN|nr:hypothetical protein D9V37_02205 [Nocardioides mangrovicus]
MPTEADGAALFEAEANGRALMCTVDEAEQRAIGFAPLDRGPDLPPFPQQQASYDDPVVVAAGRRLVERGLAEDLPTDHWAVQASGPLLAWFVGHVLPAHRSFVISVHREPDVVARRRRRVTLVGGNMSIVEYLDIPIDAGGEPLPVRIEAVRRDVLVEEIVSTAFEPRQQGQQLTVDLVTTAAHGPARFVADHEVAGLSTTGHGLRGKSERTRRIDAAGYRTYVMGLVTELAAQ